MNNKPNPGTKEAREQGCVCPVIDNHHGQGYRGVKGIFVFRVDCPLHKKKTEGDDDVPASGERRDGSG